MLNDTGGYYLDVTEEMGLQTVHNDWYDFMLINCCCIFSTACHEMSNQFHQLDNPLARIQPHVPKQTSYCIACLVPGAGILLHCFGWDFVLGA